MKAFLAQFAAWGALWAAGPTAVLIALVVLEVRRRRWARAGLYAAGIPLIWVGGPAFLAFVSVHHRL